MSGRAHNEAVGELRSCFEGPPGAATWERVARTLADLEAPRVEELLPFVRERLSRWHDPLAEQVAPVPMAARGECGLPAWPRGVPEAWRAQVLRGEPAPELALIEQLDLHSSPPLPEAARVRILQNPALTGLRALDLGEGASFGPDTCRALARSPHLSTVRHLALRLVSVEQAEALCQDDAPGLEGLRVVELGSSRGAPPPRSPDPCVVALFHAPWWSQVEGLLSARSCFDSYGLSAVSALEEVARHASRLTSLRGLALKDSAGLYRLDGEPIWGQLAHISLLSTMSAEHVLAALATHPPDTTRALDLSLAGWGTRSVFSWVHRRAQHELLTRWLQTPSLARVDTLIASAQALEPDTSDADAALGDRVREACAAANIALVEVSW